MRRSALFFLLPLLAAAPLAAQNFEGVVSVKTDTTDPNAMRDEKVHITPGRVAVTGITGSASPVGPGVEIRILMDWGTGKFTMLLPLAGPMAQFAQMNPGMKGVQMVSSIPASVAAAATSLKPLGTSQTIAGFICQDFVETTANNPRSLCLTKQLGKFTMPAMGRGGRGGAPSWIAAIGDNGFPLKVWTANGHIDFEATSVKPGAVSPSLFVIPDGFMDMSALGRMGGRGGL